MLQFCRRLVRSIIPLALIATRTLAEEPVRIVLFTPSDLAVPAGAEKRLTQITDATDKFYFKWMNHWNYPPATKSLFKREPNGQVEVLEVRGDKPVASGKYAKPNFADDVSRLAADKYHIAGTNHVWWIFVYLGDRPARFNDFGGVGNPVAGGSCMVNYDTLAGDINSNLSLVEGFNGEIFLKGMIHELGHAFGLPHMGPDPELGLGNSLMGPVTTLYVAKKWPKPDLVYLDEASASMLWKHPIFSGTNFGSFHPTGLKLLDYKSAYDSASDCVRLSGKVVTDQPAHTVVVIDDLGKPNNMYWSQSHAARIATDGAFEVAIEHPAKVDGHYYILFCLDNGAVTGDGQHVRFVNRGDIKKPYHFRHGNFDFGEN